MRKSFLLKGYGATTIKDIITDAESKLGRAFIIWGQGICGNQYFKDFVINIALALEEPLKEYTAKNDYLLVDMIEYRAYFEYKRQWGDKAFIKIFFEKVLVDDHWFKRLFHTEAIQRTVWSWDQRWLVW